MILAEQDRCVLIKRDGAGWIGSMEKYNQRPGPG
jgi:hypothetical protein